MDSQDHGIFFTDGHVPIGDSADRNNGVGRTLHGDIYLRNSFDRDNHRRFSTNSHIYMGYFADGYSGAESTQEGHTKDEHNFRRATTDVCNYIRAPAAGYNNTEFRPDEHNYLRDSMGERNYHRVTADIYSYKGASADRHYMRHAMVGHNYRSVSANVNNYNEASPDMHSGAVCTQDGLIYMMNTTNWHNYRRSSTDVHNYNGGMTQDRHIYMRNIIDGRSCRSFSTDTFPQGACAHSPLVSYKKCYTTEQNQIALCGDIKKCTNEAKHESLDKKSNNGNTSNYEQLGDNLGDHHYTLTPPNLEAIYEEIKEEGLTAEQVIEISRATIPNSDDDDDGTEDPATDYV